MSEKTEKPSQRKLKKARERGEVPQSTELTSALVLLGSLLLLWGFSKTLDTKLRQLFVDSFAQQDVEAALAHACKLLIFPIGLILVGIFCIACVAHFMQTGWIGKRKKKKSKGKSRPLFSLLKLVVIAAIGYFSSLTPPANLSFFISQIFILLLKVACALVLLGIADWIYQKWNYHRQMHMTKEEVKEEKRETETKNMFKK